MDELASVEYFSSKQDVNLIFPSYNLNVVSEALSFLTIPVILEEDGLVHINHVINQLFYIECSKISVFLYCILRIY